MSGRKESWKKSLGLTEYPWSSDDEDNPPTGTLEPSPLYRRQSENSSQPGGSGAFTSTPSDNRRNPTRLERDLFWSLLRKPNRASSAGPSRPYQPRERPSFQHILAMSKFKRILSKSNQQPEHTDLPIQRPGRIERQGSLRAAQNSDDESDAPAQDNLPESESNRDNMAEEQVVNDNASGSDEQEEVEEVDAAGDDHERNNDPQAEIGENDPDEETSTGNPTIVELLTLQGMKRRRESKYDAEPASVQELNQNLLRLLECPVCLEWMEPPMSQCHRGHLVCAPCRSRISSCPICRTSFTSIRNRAMEAVAELLRYPCRHGCGRVTHYRRRAVHEASCSARRYRCPAQFCPRHLVQSTLADLADHFQSEHSSILKMGPRHNFSIRVNNDLNDLWLVMTMREMFQIGVNVDINNWGVWFYVAYIGPKCNASNYTYEVTVSGPQNSSKLVYSRTTHSDLDSSSLNVSSQDCFHMTLEQALNFLRFKDHYVNSEKYLDFVVDISKREAPLKEKVDKPDS